jgi:regulator of protease activity HflC (stomatin/prohibitin superfamily)
MHRFILVAALLGSTVGCMSTVTPGTVEVGVETCGNVPELQRYTVVHGGRITSSPCYDYYQIPTREQRQVWSASTHEGAEQDESISFAGIDGQSLNVDVSIGYKVADEDKDIIQMVRTYGTDLASTIHTRVRDSVRNDLNMCAADLKLSVHDIYGEKKGDLFTCAEQRVQSEYQPNGLIITRVTLNSEVRLPEQVKQAMERAQAATQDADRANREVESIRAEGEKRRVAAEADAAATLTKAHAEAEANQIISSSVTPAVLELRRLEVQRTQAEKWNGQLPSTVLGSEPVMMLTPSSTSK